MDLLFSLWMGMPLWIWLAFLAAVLGLLALDLGLTNRKDHEIGVAESLRMSAFYIAMGALWSVAVWWIYSTQASAGLNDPRLAALPVGPERAGEAVKLYFTGFLVEKTLALDNIFVIKLIFSYFAIPRLYQHRVLFWGILGVIVLRASIIGMGAALVASFHWVLYLFGAFLIVTGLKMLFSRGDDDAPDLNEQFIVRVVRRFLRVTPEMHGNRFFLKKEGPAGARPLWFATPLFLCLIVIEIADLVFAVDSVPAIFAITTDAFIIYTSNIFAILGLRALYFALAAVLHRFADLKYALSIVLVFIGSKIFLGDLFFGGKFPANVSLSVTVGILAVGIAVSLWRTRGQKAELPPDTTP